MDQLALKEQKKYVTLWEKCSEYKDLNPADYLTPIFLDFFKDQVKKGERVIDFGCGSGRSAIPLSAAGLRVDLIDFCNNCLDVEPFLQTVKINSTVHFFEQCLWNLSDLVKPAEWIICFDVLEHIPEKKIDSVLKAISSRMRRGGFVSICLCDDVCGASIGEVLHLTVKPAFWWREKINHYFSILHEFDYSTAYLVLALNPK